MPIGIQVRAAEQTTDRKPAAGPLCNPMWSDRTSWNLPQPRSSGRPLRRVIPLDATGSCQSVRVRDTPRPRPASSRTAQLLSGRHASACPDLKSVFPIFPPATAGAGWLCSGRLNARCRTRLASNQSCDERTAAKQIIGQPCGPEMLEVSGRRAAKADHPSLNDQMAGGVLGDPVLPQATAGAFEADRIARNLANLL